MCQVVSSFHKIDIKRTTASFARLLPIQVNDIQFKESVLVETLMVELLSQTSIL